LSGARIKTLKIDSKAKREQVTQIIQSEEFRTSQVYQNLLAYLAEASINDNIPKETTIAIDVFGKDNEFNSNKDATVRYNIHHLRKKLESYYENEGRKDTVKLTIPKGHYEVKFSQNVAKKNGGRIAIRVAIVQAAVIVSLVIILISNIVRRDGSSDPANLHARYYQNNPYWTSFFANGLPTMVVIGDDFLLDEHRPDLERYRIVRDWEIDSESDLRQFLRRYPEENLRKSELTGIPYGAIQNILDLNPVLSAFRLPMEFRNSSNLSLDEIKHKNIIYIGEFKNLRILRQIINKLPIRFQYQPDERLFILDEKGDTTKSFLRIEAPYERKDKFNVDYSLLINLNGLSGGHLTFVVGFGYGGRLERTRMLGDETLFEDFQKDVQRLHGSFPSFFIAVFEVKSIERTGFDNEIVYFEALPSDFLKSQVEANLY
jgi:hypothetical protein